MPEREDFDRLPSRGNPVEEKVTNAWQQDTPDAREPNVGSWQADARLPRDQIQGPCEFFRQSLRAALPVLAPPATGRLDLSGRPGPEDNGQTRPGHRRSRSRRSSARTVSPRSTPAIASSSSLSSSAVASKFWSSPSAMTVTLDPSGRVTPSSGMIAPPRTRPENTCMGIVYSSGTENIPRAVRRGPNERTKTTGSPPTKPARFQLPPDAGYPGALRRIRHKPRGSATGRPWRARKEGQRRCARELATLPPALGFRPCAARNALCFQSRSVGLCWGGHRFRLPLPDAGCQGAPRRLRS